MAKSVIRSILFSLVTVLATCSAALGTQGLYSQRLEERRDAYKQLVVSGQSESGRLGTIGDLIRILRDGEHVDISFDGTLHLAIKAIGEIKAEQAIPSMLPYLTFIPKCYITDERMLTQFYYPVVRSLVEIGKPSMRFMVDVISEEVTLENEDVTKEIRSDEAKRLAAWVMMRVLGGDKAIARLQILEAQKNAARLRDGGKLSDYVRDYKPTFHHPLEKQLNSSESPKTEEKK